jgi:hypothetical protein
VRERLLANNEMQEDIKFAFAMPFAMPFAIAADTKTTESEMSVCLCAGVSCVVCLLVDVCWWLDCDCEHKNNSNK